MTRSATPWPDGDSAQPDPLESVPPPHVVRRRLYELVQATTFTRRLLRLSEKLHAGPRPAPANDGQGVVLRLVGGETDTDTARQEGGRP